MLHPDAFCWSKFGTEAGEPAEKILARKELERQRNGGTFLWGIGTSIRPSLMALLQETSDPQVLFTPMLSAPSRVDVAPDQVVLWTAGIGMDGTKYELPAYSRVTSRASRRGHFALVCSNDIGLDESGRSVGSIDRSGVCNLLTGSAVGSSQVTSVVRRVAGSRRMQRPYCVAFTARLTYPYLVSLHSPVDVPGPSPRHRLVRRDESPARLASIPEVVRR